MKYIELTTLAHERRLARERERLARSRANAICYWLAAMVGLAAVLIWLVG